MAESEDLFESLRSSLIDGVESARDSGDEDALAAVLSEIAEPSRRDLERVREMGDGGHELVAAVDAWASVASYAITRFYFEGPKSVFPGGFSKRVAGSLQGLVGTWSPFLESALKATHASSFSIAAGFPLGFSVGLAWTPGGQRVRQPLERELEMEIRLAQRTLVELRRASILP
jgi:hypothetical protein